MSVLRDAMELGYGLDHFMITGENFPAEWKDDFHSHRNHDYDESENHLDKESHGNEYVHQYVRKYNSYNDYIIDYLDNHYSDESLSLNGSIDLDMLTDNKGYNLDKNGAKKINSLTGKLITNKMLDITEYIKNIDIKEARKQGIIIKNIRCPIHPLESRKILDANIEKWIENNKVLIKQRTWTAKFSGRELRERRALGLSNKGNSTGKELTFSNFRIKTQATLEAGQNHILFSEISNYYSLKNKEHPNYNPEGTPTMLQIAFGLIKKYKDMKVEIRGYIPGINEPME